MNDALRQLATAVALGIALALAMSNAQPAEDRDVLARSVTLADRINQEIARREKATAYKSLILNRKHPLSNLLAKRASIKFFRGGRDAAKSWGAAEAAVRLMDNNFGPYANLWRAGPYRILCTREYQNSIKDSIHRLLCDQIDRMGLTHRFHRTATSLVHKYTGSEALYKGLHHNVEEIKSTEGIDIALIEEGQNMMEDSWQVLEPTIRKEDSEIWCLFNVTSEDTATHTRAVTGKPNGDGSRSDAITFIVNYDKNPFLSEKSKRVIEWLKKHDFEAYQHVYGGHPRRQSNAIIFGGRWRVEAFPDSLVDDALRENGRLYYGLDHGFASDPYALTRSFILTRNGKRGLYISHEAFGVGVEFAGEMSQPLRKGMLPRGELEALLDEVPGSRDWPILADNSRPETISFLCGKGFNVQAAEKWKGNVEDGLAYLKSFDEIVIHERCKHMQEEARMYRYKIDPKVLDQNTGAPIVLPIVVDRFNHGWDSMRYSHDGEIRGGGGLATWARLAE